MNTSNFTVKMASFVEVLNEFNDVGLNADKAMMIFSDIEERLRTFATLSENEASLVCSTYLVILFQP